MNGEQRIVYVRGIILQAEIEMQAMIAENKKRELAGESLAYTEKDFIGLIKKHGMYHNALITELCDY